MTIAGFQDGASNYTTSHLLLIYASILKVKEDFYLHLLIQEEFLALMYVHKSARPVCISRTIIES